MSGVWIEIFMAIAIVSAAAGIGLGFRRVVGDRDWFFFLIFIAIGAFAALLSVGIVSTAGLE